MQTKIPLLAAITIISSLLAIPLAVNSAHAVPGLGVLDPNNTWSPYAPAPTIKHLVLKYYDGDGAEYGAFQAGGSNGIDVADDGQAGNGPPVAQWPVYDNTCGTCTPTSNGIDWNFTLAQGSANWQGMYFNGASSTWGFWGCVWNFYNSLCGQEMRQAFSHLINRPDFVTANDGGGTGGVPVWDDAPLNKGLNVLCFTPTTAPCDGTPPFPAVGCPTLPTPDNKACLFSSPSSNFCSWDTLSNTGCTPVTGPYLAGGTGVGVGFPGIPAGPIAACPSGTSPVTNPAAWSGCNNDFALAAAHLIRAGVANGMDANYQVGAHLVNPSGVAGHHLRACVRSSQPRRTMGLGWTNALKLVMGSGGSPNTNAVDVQLGNIIVCGIDKAFTEPPTSPIDDWDMYTYGYAAGGPYDDFLYTQFNTKFTFTPGGCGGAASFTADEPNNPTFVCIDGRGSLGNADAALLKAVTTTTDETTFDHLMGLDASSALDLLGRAVASIPVHSTLLRTPALRAVTGIPSTKGLGFANILSFAVARKGPYSPVNPQFKFNNGLSPDTIRWGQASPIDFLNPFQISTVWEYNSIGGLYDTIFTANPLVPSQVYCEMCQTYQQGTVICGTPAITCTTLTIQLRQNLKWQDGATINAQDLAFSLLTSRDYSTNTAGAVGLLDHVTLDANNPLKLTIVMVGLSVGHLANLAGVPIFPMARWACPSSGISSDGSTPCNPAQYNVGTTTLPGADAFKASPGYDPVTDGNLIGSGPLACISSTGVVGTGCAFDSNGSPTGQSIGPGGALRLTAFDRAAELGDPFAQYTRLDNPSWGSDSSRSGQQQEFYYADKGLNNKVTISDLTSANLCNGASGATLNCPIASYNYWLRNAFHSGTPGTISTETAIVAAHYQDGGVTPYSWSAPGGDAGGLGTLTNVVAYGSS